MEKRSTAKAALDASIKAEASAAKMAAVGEGRRTLDEYRARDADAPTAMAEIDELGGPPGLQRRRRPS